MKIFLSWSGERSQQFAQAIHDWLPLAVHYVEPWISNSDIEAGERWATEVAKELESSNFGIICLTKDNLSSAWILFEAGALAKSMIEGRVIPLLLDVEFKDIAGPLAQFQSKKFSKKGVSEVITSINKLAQVPIAEKILSQLFDTLWPQLDQMILQIPQSEVRTKNRPQHEVLEELVSGVRGLDSRVREIIEEGGFRSRGRRARNIEMAVDITLGELEITRRDPLALVIITSHLRDYLPWIYDLALQLYFESLSGEYSEKSSRLNRQITRAIAMLRRGPLFDIIADGSKQNYMLMREIERYLRSIEIENEGNAELISKSRWSVTQEKSGGSLDK